MWNDMFDSPDLLGLVAGHARHRHLADLAVLRCVNKTARRSLEHVVQSVEQELRMKPRGNAAGSLANDLYAVYARQGRLIVFPGAEKHRDFLPGMMLAFKEHPQIVSLSTHRSTWKGAEVVRFLDLFSKQFPDRILAWDVDFLPPPKFRPDDWEQIRAHPAVRSGVVQLVDGINVPVYHPTTRKAYKRTCGMDDVMAHYIRKARQARGRRRERSVLASLGE